MNNIPTIGGKGIFEIFVPGLFLVLHIAAFIYLFPNLDDETLRLLKDTTSDPVVILVIATCFGYLTGILLRLFRADIADDWSGRWLRKFYRSAKLENGKFKLWATDNFPYLNHLGDHYIQCLPDEVVRFYEEIWAKRKGVDRNKSFFTFCKLMVISHNEKAANEIYAAEALSRYVASMFYALCVAFILVLLTLVLRYIVLGEVVVGLVFVLITYLFAIAGILQNFRFIRIKEVETVFVASFADRDFEENAEKKPVREKE